MHVRLSHLDGHPQRAVERPRARLGDGGDHQMVDGRHARIVVAVLFVLLLASARIRQSRREDIHDALARGTVTLRV